MSALTSPSAHSTVDAPTVPPTRRPRGLLIALAVVAPLAPLCQGLGYLLSPAGNSDDPLTILGAVAGQPGLTAALGWLSLVIGLTLVPGVIATGLAALPRAPRLATAALLVAVPGWAAGLLLPTAEPVAAALLAAGVPNPEAVRLLGQLTSMDSPAAGVAVLIFVAGHVIGTVLLGLALYRARAVPRPIAVLLALAQPLHFVAFVVLQNTYLDITAAWLTAIGFGVAAASLVRGARTH